ncbi:MULTISPECIES: DNA polymerase I [Enterococcus]|uniref:DNA polymerase I n=1 Tax=Enterococcus sulfureus ATCC 49903 TaxID=1140003 RepID=S0L857_9ENTE|nr:DNA polymerase I [Enterococcus sulfureus]EOT47686.1 DNA polymerase I [Enterococcus sulfureus ATCC 49903]EOT83893.1 DNA polymerase I [Enterococcus sulfureus ATCC 49903]
MTKNKLLLVDGNSVAFRAFFALHQSLERFKNSNGLHTNALYAFHNMFTNVMDKEQPTHVLVAFDAGKTTFRNEWYEEYKGGRAKTPSEFKEQMPYLRELIAALGVKHYELSNYEADDIIGTLAKSVDPNEFDVVVLTGDRDLTQLASDHIRVDITVKGVSEIESYTPAFIAEKYNGLTPNQIIDMKGLAGDASDNIPGVTKIGEKTAIKLLTQFGSVEGIYDHLDELKKSKMKENLIADHEQALLSKRLATIDTDAPVAVSIEDLIYTGKDFDALIAFYQEMNFQSFLEKLAVPDDIKKMDDILFEYVEEATAEMFGDKGALYVEMLEDNYHTSDIVGVAWSCQEKTYVTDQVSIFDNPYFKAWLADDKIEKRVFDAKRTTVALTRYDQQVNGIRFDLLLAAYLLDTNDSSNDIATIASHYGYHQVQTDEQVYGKGAKKGLPEDLEAFYAHLARKVQTIEYLQPNLLEELHAKNQLELFQTIELPLAFILAEMEMTGISVDTSRLIDMRTEFAERLHAIEEKIFEQAGERFNLNSPKQLGVILFEKMELPVIKKTKTGYSTAVDVLEQLREQAPIVDDILIYRQIAKIQSTYVEGLLRMIQQDGKVHTRYIQTLTQTGRLSSVDPNLQNIPIRLEEGRKIRQAFVPRQKDWVIYSSDYSQIELRVLADMSHDEHLQQAFIDKQDIHTSTAMRVFGVSESEVTSNMRRDAKAVNFGIVYGISDYGLSQNLGITRKAAQNYIDTYFERYPGVKTYMEEIVTKAKQQGFVETLYHRRRYLPDLASRNYNIRSFAERTAINTPIQGSAADILKIAMIQLAKRLKEEKLEATMLLQVHDELVFEVPEQEVLRLDALVKEVMNHAVSLAVPLVSDSSWGNTWYDAK